MSVERLVDEFVDATPVASLHSIDGAVMTLLWTPRHDWAIRGQAGDDSTLTGRGRAATAKHRRPKWPGAGPEP